MVLVMDMSFSKRLLEAMQKKDISTRKLSELTGIPKSAIQRYTSGDTEKIPIDRMKLMAEALGIDPAYIMGWETEEAGKKLKDIGQQLTAPFRSDRFITLSEGLAKMEKENAQAFQALYTYLISAYPYDFTERTDDNANDSES